MLHAVTPIPGDGIGPEVTRAVLRIVEAAGVDTAWEREAAGQAAGTVRTRDLADTSTTTAFAEAICATL